MSTIFVIQPALLQSTMNPDSSVKVAVKTVRSKPDFFSMVSFSMNCILQSLQPNNSKHDDNLDYLLSEKFYNDINRLLSKQCEDKHMVGRSLAVLNKLMAHDHDTVSLTVLNDGLMKNVALNIVALASDVETTLELMVQLQAVSACKPMVYGFVCRMLATIRMDPEDAEALCEFMAKEEFITMDKASLFAALAKQQDRRVVQRILDLLWKAVIIQKEVTNQQAANVLEVVSKNFSDLKIAYLSYNILSTFNKFQALMAKNTNPDLSNSITYIYTIAQDNISFAPKIQNEKQFLQTVGIMLEAGNLAEFLEKVFAPKFNLLKSQESQLTFITALRKNCLKQNMSDTYEIVREFQGKSTHKSMAGQYECLLKYINKDHKLSGSILQHVEKVSENVFVDYFKTILQATVVFNVRYTPQQANKFVELCLRFLQTKSLGHEYLYYLNRIAHAFFDRHYKQPAYQQLLLKVYDLMIEHKFSEKKLHKLEKLISAAFSSVDIGSLLPSRACLVIPVLMLTPEYFMTAADKLPIMKSQLPSNSWAEVPSKFHTVFNLLSSYKLHPNTVKVIETAISWFTGVLESDQDKPKKVALGWVLYYLKKLKKNSLLLQLLEEEKIQLGLDKLFFVLLGSIKVLKAAELYDLLFQLESWVDLPALLRKNQAEVVLSGFLQTTCDYTTDAIDLMLLCLDNCPPQYPERVRRTKLLKNLQDNMNTYRPEQLVLVQKIYNNFDKLIAINYFKQHQHLQNLIPSLPSLITANPSLQYMLKENQDCTDISKIIGGSTVVLKQLSGLKKDVLVKEGKFGIFEHQIKLIIGLLLWVTQDDTTLPTEMVESLAALLTFEFSDSVIIKDILTVIADRPHNFNLTKINFNYMYTHFLDNLKILEYLNDFLELICDSKPQVLQQYNISNLIIKVLSNLVSSQQTPLIKQQIKFVQTSLECPSYHDLLLDHLPILHRIVDSDLLQPNLYRPYIVQFALDLLDKENDLAGSVDKIARVLDKFNDEDEISYISTMALKDAPKEDVLRSVPAQTLIAIMMGQEDEEVKQNCKELLKNYTIEDKFQKEFVSSFKRQDYDKCEELLPLLEKPHELTWDPQDLNKLLAYHYKKKGQSKLKDFLMSYSQTSAALHDCDNLYKFDMYIDDILSSAPKPDQLFLSQINLTPDGKIKYTPMKLKFNQKQVGSIVKREQIIQNLAKQLETNMNINNIDKVRLLCLYSQLDQLRPIIKQHLKPAILNSQAYQSQLYNLRLPLFLPGNHNSIPTSHLVNHLRTHLSSFDPSQEQYYQKLLTDILSRKDKQPHVYSKLMQLVVMSFQHYNEFVVKLSKELSASLQENSRLLRFAADKQEDALNTLRIITLLYLVRSGEHQALGLKGMEGLYSGCKSAMDYDLFMMLAEGYVSDTKDAYQAWVELKGKLTQTDELQKQCTDVGKKILEKLEQLKPKEVSKVDTRIEQMKAEAEVMQIKPSPENSQQIKPLQTPPSSVPNKTTLATTSTTSSSSTIPQSVKEPESPIPPSPPRASKPILPQSQITINAPFFKAPPKTSSGAGISESKQDDKVGNSLKEYGHLFEDIMEKDISTIDQKTLSGPLSHIFDVCDNPFYYKKILKLNLLEKLILLGAKINASPALPILVKISRNRSKDILKQPHILQYLKRQLKMILQNKSPNAKQSLTQISTLILNSQYEFSKQYFAQGLYSVMIELAKANILQLEVLKFYNKIAIDEKIVNELYQRGLIQQAVVGLADKGNPELLAEWMKLIGKICINPAIQKKLMSLNIHQAILKIFTESGGNELQGAAAATALAAIALNNPPVIEWAINKKVHENILKINFSKASLSSICNFLYSLTYNSDEGKKLVQVAGGLHFLIKVYTDQMQTKFPDPDLLKQCLKAIATMSMLKQNCVCLMKHRMPSVLVDDLKGALFMDYFSSMLETLTNITRGIDSQKEYLDIKDQKIWQVLKFLKQQTLKNNSDYENIMTILFNLYKFDKKPLSDLSLFQHIFWGTLNKQIPDSITHMMLKVFTDVAANSKTSSFSEDIFSSLQKICMKRANDSFMPEIVQILSIVNSEQDQRVMGKYKFAEILCDGLPGLTKTPEDTRKVMAVLEVISRLEGPAGVIAAKIGGNLLQSQRDVTVYKMLGNLCQYKNNIDVLLQSGLLQLIRRELPVCNPNECKQLLLLLKTILSHLKLAKADSESLSQTLSSLKSSQNAAIIKQVTGLLSHKQAVLTNEIRQFMNKGVPAKLFKNDGSVSDLLVLVTKCCKEINCVDKNEPGMVKPKWRVAINEITCIEMYGDEGTWRKSNFYKSSFMGKTPEKERCLSIISSRNDLHMYFDSKAIRDQWLQGLKATQLFVSQALSILR